MGALSRHQCACDCFNKTLPATDIHIHVSAGNRSFREVRFSELMRGGEVTALNSAVVGVRVEKDALILTSYQIGAPPDG